MFHVKYKIFCYIKYYFVPKCRGTPYPNDCLQGLHFISKTLETFNNSQENYSLKPCTIAVIHFVEIK